jgi:hypothetical protein
LFTFIAVVVMLVRWQLRYGNVNTADPDYPVAKRNKNFALVLWLVALPAGFVIRPLAGTLLAKLFE